MTADQAWILAVLAATVVMFVWGRWRHDVVAMGALLVCVWSGLVGGSEAFLGFGHPAVITVACVLVLSSALQSSGAVDALTRVALPRSASPLVTITTLTSLAAVLSAFMNNVGALALLMPVAVQMATRLGLPPGKLLMPLAFASIFGGMTTLIGTPPNLVVSSFRASLGGGGYSMFDFTPVGIGVAAGGIMFVILFARWLVPARQRSSVESFETGTYLTEARVEEGSKAAGMSLREIDNALQEIDAQVVGLIRNERRIPAPHLTRHVQSGDILVIEAEPEALASALSALGLTLEEEVNLAGDGETSETDGSGAETGDTDDKSKRKPEQSGERPADVGTAIRSEDVLLLELVVLPGSPFIGRSASDIRLRSRYGLNLLALSRRGQRSLSRLRTARIEVGDVLLMQGTPDALYEFAAQFECVPLAERPLRIPDRRRALITGVIMAMAIGGAALGLIPAAIAFASGVLAVLVLQAMPLRAVYGAVDWSVVVLLGALIPVAGAMESTGAAGQIASLLLGTIAGGDAVIALVLILVVTMTLSDFMNNAATAAVMAPIAIQAASQLGTSPDSFLMAVAIGASCAFLTPIGHQNNTLILGPGGFRFGDYWRLGLPLEILVVVIAVPLLLWIWPL
jgi:di/tricarboxylate transporter